MNRSRIVAVSLAAGVLLAGLAPGQNADPNSAGPTKNDYRLKVVEPAEAATITGSTVQVVVALNPPPEVGGEKKDVNSMPRPRVDIFLDNESRGTLADLHNVMNLEGVSPGTHTLVVLAKNMSGEVIDRKQINFSSTAATVAQSTVETHRAPAAAPPVAPPPAPPARVESAPPPPARAEIAPPPPAPAPRAEVPATGSSVPLTAAAGLALLVTGLVLRRRG